MNTEEQVLYIKDNKGAIREWGISAEGNVITIRHGQCMGSMQYRTETITEGKATRSVDEQIMSRMASRISKQRDKGYNSDLNHALSHRPVNTLGLPKPMLAQKIKSVRNIDYTDAIVQPKFDGNRCLIYYDKLHGKNKAYSRNGKPILAITHILDDLEIPDGMILDGELYCHGYPLQTIVSWIKREQPETLNIKYHIYDVVSNLPYKSRSEMIRGIPIGDSISPVYGTPISSYEGVLKAFREYRADGYEGAILRWGDSGYEDGKRSKSLVKVKHWEDDEFEVIDVHSSRDGWGILECLLPNGKTFCVSAPGTIKQKEHVMLNPYQYKRRILTVEYANLTNDGIPFHPIAINFRDEIQ